MKYLVISLTTFLVSSEIFAAGFTWIGTVVPKGTDHIFTFVFVALVILFIGIVYRSKVQKSSNPVIPDKGFTLKNLCEAYGHFIMNQAKSIIGEEEGPKYFSFLAALFLILVLNNLVGLVPGFLPPTENFNTTFALGAISFIYYNMKGCKEQGILNYLKHFCGPLWYLAFLILPIEIISNFIRPLSLGLRLRSVMYGDHLVLGIFSDLAPIIIPIIFMILGILVSLIQAFVFTILSAVYISMAVAHHDHDEGHAH